MTAAPVGGAPADPGLELLERALAYTRGCVVGVTDADLALPTPCRGWDLDRLLDHMLDALAAFTEAATGRVALTPLTGGRAEQRVAVLLDRACSLLGTWSSGVPPPDVGVGDASLPTTVLVHLAALEVTVHGWDVGRATGRGRELPDDLARALLPTARALVADPGRDEHFARPLPTAPGAGPGTRLLAHLGRRG